MIEDMTVRKLAPKTQATYTTMAPWPPRPATSQGRRSVTIIAAEKRQACRPPSPQFTRQDPPAPPQSRRDTMPAGLAAGQFLAVQQTSQAPQATVAAVKSP